MSSLEATTKNGIRLTDRMHWRELDQMPLERVVSEDVARGELYSRNFFTPIDTAVKDPALSEELRRLAVRLN